MAAEKHAITGSHCRKETEILQVYEIRHWRKKSCQPIENRKEKQKLLDGAIEAVSRQNIFL